MSSLGFFAIEFVRRCRLTKTAAARITSLILFPRRKMKPFSEASESSKSITTTSVVEFAIRASEISYPSCSEKKTSTKAAQNIVDSDNHSQAQSRLNKSSQEELPADIVYTILVNLPVKTLSRFKLACKSWFSLISSPQFQKDHYHQSEKKPLLLTMRSCCEGSAKLHAKPHYLSDFTLHFFIYNSANGSPINNFSKSFKRPFLEIQFISIQSCLGLVCIASACGVVLLCNPSTGEIIKLPPSCYTHCIGFGYSTSTAEFKVAKFLYCRVQNYCTVWDMATGEWKEARGPPFLPRRYYAPFIHGAFHLMPQAGTPVDNRHIAAFDVDSEEYTTIPLPKHKSYGKKARVHLAELGGSLSLTFDFTYKGGRLEIWFLKDYNNGEWVKRHTIDLCKDSPPSPWNEGPIEAYPVGMLGENSIFLNVSGSELWCYDLQDKKLTRKIVNEFDDKYYDLESAVYVETLFALKSR